MKALAFLLLAFVVPGSQNAVFGCHNSSLTLNSIEAVGGGNYDIAVTVCFGGGVGGADADTKNFFFSFFKTGGLTVSSFTPSVTSGIGVTYSGIDQGSGDYPAGQATILYIDCIPECAAFECTGSTGSCGSAHQTCRQFVFTTNAEPDSIRVFGVEGNGNPFGGCYPDADMKIVFSSPALPVELVSFSAKSNGGLVDLHWRTAQESNSQEFVVMRSTDGIRFQPIAKIAACGFCASGKSYTYQDHTAPVGQVYYKLLMRDFDGTEAFSPVIAPLPGRWPKVSVFPNPIAFGTQDLSIRFDRESAPVGSFTLAIYNLLGKKVFEQKITSLPSPELSFRPERPLPPGIYFLSGFDQRQLFGERLVVRGE